MFGALQDHTKPLYYYVFLMHFFKKCLSDGFQKKKVGAGKWLDCGLFLMHSFPLRAPQTQFIKSDRFENTQTSLGTNYL